MDRTEIIAAVFAYAPDTAIEQSIPTFIQLAEADINRELRNPEMVVRTFATLGEDQEYMPVPDDYASIRTIEVLGPPPSPLERRDADMLTTLRSLYSTTDQPVFFGIVGREIQFVPPADADYPLELTYHRRLEPLTTDEPENWLSIAHPDVYIYGALTHAANFLGETGENSRGVAWAGLFKAALASIASDGKLQGG
jgi:hypothetical protein